MYKKLQIQITICFEPVQFSANLKRNLAINLIYPITNKSGALKENKSKIEIKVWLIWHKRVCVVEMLNANVFENVNETNQISVYMLI